MNNKEFIELNNEIDRFNRLYNGWLIWLDVNDKSGAISIFLYKYTHLTAYDWLKFRTWNVSLYQSLDAFRKIIVESRRTVLRYTIDNI
jgi:hypothetical protein